MAISINWGTKVITIPQSYLTLITGTLYELDTEQFRLDLKALEDDEEGMPFLDTHKHATSVTVAGVTYARFIEIINGYSITFENGSYSVRLKGSNNNFFDVENGILNQNQVQVIPGNAAGLIVVETGVSGLTPEESDQLMSLPDSSEVADSIWDELGSGHLIAGSFGEMANRVLRATEVRQGTVQDDTPSSLKFITDLTETASNFWERAGLMFITGQNMGQIRGIKSYQGVSKEVTLETPLSYAPVQNDQFIIFASRKYLSPNLDDVPPLIREELKPELAFIKNRLRINKDTGEYTVYDSDKVTPLYTGQISDDGTFKDRVPD